MPFIRKRRWIIRLSLKASKSHIIVKEKYQDKAKHISRKQDYNNHRRTSKLGVSYWK